MNPIQTSFLSTCGCNQYFTRNVRSPSEFAPRLRLFARPLSHQHSGLVVTASSPDQKLQLIFPLGNNPTTSSHSGSPVRANRLKLTGEDSQHRPHRIITSPTKCLRKAQGSKLNSETKASIIDRLEECLKETNEIPKEDSKGLAGKCRQTESIIDQQERHWLEEPSEVLSRSNSGETCLRQKVDLIEMTREDKHCLSPVKLAVEGYTQSTLMHSMTEMSLRIVGMDVSCMSTGQGKSSEHSTSKSHELYQLQGKSSYEQIFSARSHYESGVEDTLEKRKKVITNFFKSDHKKNLDGIGVVPIRSGRDCKIIKNQNCFDNCIERDYVPRQIFQVISSRP